MRIEKVQHLVSRLLLVWSRVVLPSSHARNNRANTMYRTQPRPGGGGYFLISGYWGCAAGWGRIFTTGLTIMGLHF